MLSKLRGWTQSRSLPRTLRPGLNRQVKVSQGDKTSLTALAAKRAFALYEKWRKPELAAKYGTGPHHPSRNRVSPALILWRFSSVSPS